MKKSKKNLDDFWQIIVIIFINFAIISTITIANPSQPLNIISMSAINSSEKFSEIRSLIERQANAWESANVDQLVADFAEDSLFVVPDSTIKGKSALADTARGYFANFTNIKIEIKRIIFQENVGAVEWTWRDKNKNTNEESYAEDAIIFELENNQIKYWREYIDKKGQK